MTLRFIDVTNANGQIIEPTWLSRAEVVHRQLRTELGEHYVQRLSDAFANGARMTVAVKNEQVLGVAVWRVIVNTYEGRRFYIDDLVTDEAHRSQGLGKDLLAHMESVARQLNCDMFTLDSGTQRTQAHAFYFREGMHISSFCFRKKLL